MAQHSVKANVLVGVCAGIAAYKTCEMVRCLVQDNYSVKVMMTPSAGKFVTPLTFQTLSRNPVYSDMFVVLGEESLRHISLAQWPDICLIAPLSANTLSKITCGLCDNLLTTVICALPEGTPVLLAPAMNENMWKNAVIQDNLNKLVKLKKHIILNPQKGELACGVDGEGRMMEPTDILKQLKSVLKK